jgi:ethanolamine ammonia-lyase large subunit
MYSATIGARRYAFDDLRTLLAKASPLRSGDQLAGLAADSGDPADIDRALSPHALTTVLATRFHIVERVKRSLNSDLAKPSKAA